MLSVDVVLVLLLALMPMLAMVWMLVVVWMLVMVWMLLVLVDWEAEWWSSTSGSQGPGLLLCWLMDRLIDIVWTKKNTRNVCFLNLSASLGILVTWTAGRAGQSEQRTKRL